MLRAAEELIDPAARGEIKVSLPTLLDERYAAQIASEFQAAYPEVLLDIRSEDRAVDLIGEGYACSVRTGEPALETSRKPWTGRITGDAISQNRTY